MELQALIDDVRAARRRKTPLHFQLCTSLDADAAPGRRPYPLLTTCAVNATATGEVCYWFAEDAVAASDAARGERLDDGGGIGNIRGVGTTGRDADGSHVLSSSLLSLMLADLGLVQWSAGELADAQQSLSQAALGSPSASSAALHRAHVLLTRLFLWQRKASEAVVMARKALEVDIDCWLCHAWIGDVLFAQLPRDVGVFGTFLFASVLVTTRGLCARVGVVSVRGWLCECLHCPLLSSLGHTPEVLSSLLLAMNMSSAYASDDTVEPLASAQLWPWSWVSLPSAISTGRTSPPSSPPTPTAASPSTSTTDSVSIDVDGSFASVSPEDEAVFHSRRSKGWVELPLQHWLLRLRHRLAITAVLHGAFSVAVEHWGVVLAELQASVEANGHSTHHLTVLSSLLAEDCQTMGVWAIVAHFSDDDHPSGSDSFGGSSGSSSSGGAGRGAKSAHTGPSTVPIVVREAGAPVPSTIVDDTTWGFADPVMSLHTLVHMSRKQAARGDAGEWLSNVAVAIVASGRNREAFAAAASVASKVPHVCLPTALAFQGRVAFAAAAYTGA